MTPLQRLVRDGRVNHDPHGLPGNIAAVDLGSNSFHMIVARPNPGELVVVDRLREMVQLATGLGRDRRLDSDAQERARDCLRRFGQRLKHLPPRSVRAVGTNTLRVARDSDDFIAEAEAALGHSIETISGIEEARLIYLGVAHGMPDPAARRLVVDIGGGSTEVIVGENLRPARMDSLYLGCVTLSRAHFPAGEIDAKKWRRAEVAALQELEPLQAPYRILEWERAVGASGTVRSVEAVVRAAGWSKEGITPKALRKLRDAMIKSGHVDELPFEGLSPSRRAVFPGGAVLLGAVLESLDIDRLHQADGALREGLLYDLLGRITAEDVRSRSVSALAERYHVDRAQAIRVGATALQLLDQAAGAWKLEGPEYRNLLLWAADLHEVGLDIAHRHYHRHGEYVVAESELLGFTREEQWLLSALVRAHRRKFPTTVVKELPRRRGREVERLGILLRLAVVLRRSRSPEPVPEPSLAAAKKTVALTFPEGWLDEKPLTRADLEQERNYLKSIGVALEFQ